MAIYEGSTGIKSLKDKINMKSRMVVGESLEKLNTHMVDESPLGAPFYRSTKGLVENDVGDYKNSWSVGLGSPTLSSRGADTTGASAVADGIVKGKLYNLEELSFVTNNVGHADMVEVGWNDNPEYGWKAKDGYHVVEHNIGVAEAILIAVATKVSKL